MGGLPVQPKKVLILHSGGIGDLLMALPALRIFRQNFPCSTLELMGQPERLSLVAFDLQAQLIHSIDRSPMAYFYLDGEGLPSEASAFFSSFDMVTIFGKSPGSSLGRNLQRAGVGRVITLPSFPPEGGKVHVSEYLLQAVRSAGIEGEYHFSPLLLSEDALTFARSFWEEHGLKEAEGVLAIHPGSGSPRKNWNPENFARVANWASQRAKVLLISGPAQDGVEEVRRALKEASPIVVDNLPLIHLAAILKVSTAYLGNDSGITHLAASLGLPAVAIFGPSDPAIWGPRGPAVRVLYDGNSCSPCSSEVQSGCSGHCLRNIEPDRVIEVLAPLLK